MIIEDIYYESSYNEDRYDYLFKGKSKQERQQKKEQRKANSPVRKITAPVRKVKTFVKNTVKTVVAAPAAARTLVRTNFGMMDKNKNTAPNKRSIRPSFIKRPRPVPMPLPPPAPVMEEAPETPAPETNPVDMQDNTQQVTYPSANAVSEAPENDNPAEEPVSEGNESDSPTEAEPEQEPEAEAPSEESNFDEPEKSGNSKSKDKKGSGIGAAFGWVCLGLTVLGIAYLISREPDGEELSRTAI